MTDSAEESSSKYAAQKTFAQQTASPEGFMVEDVQWARIRRKVGEIETTRAPEWILGIASVALGIAGSAGIAYAVLPKNAKELAGGVKPSLIAIGIAALVVGLVLGFEYLRQRRSQIAEKTDLQDEMDTIRQAWGGSNSITKPEHSHPTEARFRLRRSKKRV